VDLLVIDPLRLVKPAAADGTSRLLELIERSRTAHAFLKAADENLPERAGRSIQVEADETTLTMSYRCMQLRRCAFRLRLRAVPEKRVKKSIPGPPLPCKCGFEVQSKKLAQSNLV